MVKQNYWTPDASLQQSRDVYPIIQPVSRKFFLGFGAFFSYTLLGSVGRSGMVPSLPLLLEAIGPAGSPGGSDSHMSLITSKPCLVGEPEPKSVSYPSLR